MSTRFSSSMRFVAVASFLMSMQTAFGDDFGVDLFSSVCLATNGDFVAIERRMNHEPGWSPVSMPTGDKVRKQGYWGTSDPHPLIIVAAVPVDETEITSDCAVGGQIDEDQLASRLTELGYAQITDYLWAWKPRIGLLPSEAHEVRIFRKQGSVLVHRLGLP